LLGPNSTPTWLRICVKHLVGLPDPSPRLQRLVIRSAEPIGSHDFGKVGAENFVVGLPDRLDVSADEVDSKSEWREFLLDVIVSPEGRDLLPYSRCVSLTGLSIRCYGDRRNFASYDPRIAVTLQDAGG